MNGGTTTTHKATPLLMGNKKTEWVTWLKPMAKLQHDFASLHPSHLQALSVFWANLIDFHIRNKHYSCYFLFTASSKSIVRVSLSNQSTHPEPAGTAENHTRVNDAKQMVYNVIVVVVGSPHVCKNSLIHNMSLQTIPNKPQFVKWS